MVAAKMLGTRKGRSGKGSGVIYSPQYDSETLITKA